MDWRTADAPSRRMAQRGRSGGNDAAFQARAAVDRGRLRRDCGSLAVAGARGRRVLQGQDGHLHRRHRARRRLRRLWPPRRRIHAETPARLHLRGEEHAGRRPRHRRQRDLRRQARRAHHRLVQHRPHLQPAYRPRRGPLRPDQDVVDRQGGFRSARHHLRRALADQDLRGPARVQGAGQVRDRRHRQRLLCGDGHADQRAAAACQGPDRLQRQPGPARHAPQGGRLHGRLALHLRAVRRQQIRPLRRPGRRRRQGRAAAGAARRRPDRQAADRPDPIADRHRPLHGRPARHAERAPRGAAHRLPQGARGQGAAGQGREAGAPRRSVLRRGRRSKPCRRL